MKHIDPEELAKEAEKGTIEREFKDYGKFQVLEHSPLFVLKDVYYTISGNVLEPTSKNSLVAAIINYLNEWLQNKPKEGWWKIEDLPTEVLRSCYYKLFNKTIRGTKRKVANRLTTNLREYIER